MHTILFLKFAARVKENPIMKFNWFGEHEHRVFNYKPRYYDPEKEALRQKFGRVDGSMEREKEKGTYVPGSYLHGAFRDGNYAKRRGSTRAQSILGLVALLLVFGILIFIAKFYSML